MANSFKLKFRLRRTNVAMYSKNFYKILELVSVYGAFLGATCICFDSKLKLYFVTTTLRRRYYVIVGLQVALWFFVGGRTLQVYFQGDINNEFPMCYVYALLVSANVGLIVSLANQVDEVRYIITEILLFGSDFQRKWMPKLNTRNSPTGLKLEVFSGVIAIVVGLVVPAVAFAAAFIFRELPIFPHNLLPNSWRSSWIILLPSFTGYLCMCYTLGAFIIQQFIICALYYATVLPIVEREFRTNTKKGEYRTSGTLREMENLLREYRTVEYLHNRAFRLYGFYVLYTHIHVGQLVLYCNYALISHKVHLSGFLVAFLIPVALIAVVFWTLILEFSGRFHKEATKALKSWKFMQVNEGKRKLLKKYRRRFRPLRISAGDYFKVTRLTVLKFLRGIVKGTFRALLTL